MLQYTEYLNRIFENSGGKVRFIWGGDVAWNAAKVVELATQKKILLQGLHLFFAWLSDRKDGYLHSITKNILINSK